MIRRMNTAFAALHCLDTASGLLFLLPLRPRLVILRHDRGLCAPGKDLLDRCVDDVSHLHPQGLLIEYGLLRSTVVKLRFEFVV